MNRLFAAVVLAVGWLALFWGCAPRSGETASPPPPAVPALPGKPVDPVRDEGARLALEVTSLPESPLAAAPGLETADGWKLADWEDPGQLKPMMVGTAKKTLLRLATAGGPKGKSTAYLDKDLALAAKGNADLAVYNPGAAPVQVALAFQVASSWVYYESSPREVPPRSWKVFAFDLAASDFKTESSGWKYTASLWKRGEIKRIGVVLASGGAPAAVYFEGLRLAEGQAAAPAPEPARPPMTRPRPPRPPAAPEAKPEPKPAPPPEVPKPKPPAPKPEPDEPEA